MRIQQTGAARREIEPAEQLRRRGSDAECTLPRGNHPTDSPAQAASPVPIRAPVGAKAMRQRLEKAIARA